MHLSNIVMILMTTAMATHETLHFDKTHMSYLIQKLRPNDNFLNDVTRNIQKAVNRLFDSLHLSEIFSKEPKIKVILKMIYHLDDMSQKNLQFYDTLRNVSAADADNRPINQMRMHELIIRILNEKQVDVNDETDVRKTENSISIASNESSELANRTEFKEFIRAFIAKLKNLTVTDILKEKEIDIFDYVDQSGRRNLEVWEPDTKEMDFSNTSSRRVFGGRKAHIVSYPFVASIHILNEFMCSGAVISKDLIITAASCLQLHYNNRFFHENPRTTVVRVGSDWLSRRGESIPVLEIFFHPQYDPKTLNNNIAVMRLQKTLHFHSRNRTKVRRILLDDGDGNLPINTNAITLLGWGAKSASQVVNTFDKLNYIILPIYPTDHCKKIYSNEFVGQNQFCAGFFSKGGGGCNKDVGAPGVVGRTLVGIVSFGPPVCGAPDLPTVFTRIGPYLKWIQRIKEVGPDVYGVPTTSPRLNEYLNFVDMTTRYTLPDMHPLYLFTKSIHEQQLEQAPMRLKPSLRTEVDTQDDIAVLRQIISGVNNNEEVIHKLINEDLYDDFRDFLKPGTDANKSLGTADIKSSKVRSVAQIAAPFVFRSQPSTTSKLKKYEKLDEDSEYL